LLGRKKRGGGEKKRPVAPHPDHFPLHEPFTTSDGGAGGGKKGGKRERGDPRVRARTPRRCSCFLLRAQLGGGGGGGKKRERGEGKGKGGGKPGRTAGAIPSSSLFACPSHLSGSAQGRRGRKKEKEPWRRGEGKKRAITSRRCLLALFGRGARRGKGVQRKKRRGKKDGSSWAHLSTLINLSFQLA